MLSAPKQLSPAFLRSFQGTEESYVTGIRCAKKYARIFWVPLRSRVEGPASLGGQTMANWFRILAKCKLIMELKHISAPRELKTLSGKGCCWVLSTWHSFPFGVYHVTSFSSFSPAQRECVSFSLWELQSRKKNNFSCVRLGGKKANE